MKTRLRSEEELKKMAKYLNETYNVRENRYVSLALPSFPLYPTMAQSNNQKLLDKANGDESKIFIKYSTPIA